MKHEETLKASEERIRICFPPKEGKFSTVQQLINEVGMSHATFYRRMRYYGVELPGRLLSPAEQEAIKEILGFYSTDGIVIKNTVPKRYRRESRSYQFRKTYGMPSAARFSQAGDDF
jgi:hypothetical protein